MAYFNNHLITAHIYITDLFFVNVPCIFATLLNFLDFEGFVWIPWNFHTDDRIIHK